MINNKRGDVPVTILVVGTFLLCGFAILSFFASDFQLSNSFSSLKVMDVANSQIEEFIFYENQNISTENFSNLFKVIEKEGIKYLYFERKSFGVWGIGKEEIIFSVHYPLQ